MSQTITLDEEKPLSHGLKKRVFQGTYQGSPVAVKRVRLTQKSSDSKGEKDLLKLSHPNVIKLLHSEDNQNYKHYALELCAGSMDQLFLPEGDPHKYSGPPIIKPIKALHQLASGLAYIHSHGLVHGDIKPENVLISIDTEPATLKWSDFGLSKDNHQPSSFDHRNDDPFSMPMKRPMMNQEEMGNEIVWKAPEVTMRGSHFKDHRHFLMAGRDRHYDDYRIANQVTDKSDTFSAGCIFYKYLTGLHPFGDRPHYFSSDIEMDNPTNYNNKKILSYNHFAHDCIGKMIKLRPEKRMSMSQVEEYLSKKIKTELYDLCSLTEPTEDEMDQLAKLVKDPDWPDLNKPNDEGLSPIILLARNNRSEKLYRCIEILLNAAPNLDVNKLDKYGVNTLHYLCVNYCRSDLIDIFRLLIERGGLNLNQKQSFRQVTPLQQICKNYRSNRNIDLIEILKLMIDKGADINDVDDNGKTVLHVLCHYYEGEEMIPIIRLFASYGINLNARHKTGKTALHFICQNRKPGGCIYPVFKLLIEEYGIRLDPNEYYVKTALHYLCEKYQGKDLFDVIKLLVDRGVVDVKTKDANEMTVLHHFCRNYEGDDLIKIIKFFMENGVDYVCKTKEGRAAKDLLRLRDYLFEEETIEEAFVLLTPK